MPPRLPLLAAALLSLALAPSAQAGSAMIGSDLAPDATIEYHDPNDWAAWNPDMLTSPVTGEVNAVSIKGFMQLEGRAQQPPIPGVVMHVMVLRPQGNGTVAVVPGGVSEDLPLPLEQDPTMVHTYTRSDLTRPDGPDGKGGSRLCIQQGDYLAFTTSGGFGGDAQQNPESNYVNGAHFQVFGSSQATTLFQNQGGAYDFDPFRGAPKAGQELLMNAVIGTREDARYTCRTDAEKKENLDAPKPAPPADPTAPAPGQATIAAPKGAPKVKRNRVAIGLGCSATGPCSGTLALRSYAKPKAFSLAAGQTGKVRLKVNKRARKKLKRRGSRLTVKAMLHSADGSSQYLRFKIKRA